MLAASKRPMRNTGTGPARNRVKAHLVANIDRGQNGTRCLRQPSRSVVLAALFDTAFFFLYSIVFKYIHALPTQARIQKADAILLAIELLPLLNLTESSTTIDPLPSPTQAVAPTLRHPPPSSTDTTHRPKDVSLPTWKRPHVW